MKKYEGKANLIGNLLEQHRKRMRLSKEEVCRRAQLLGVDIHRVELYRMEIGISIIKDFELVALCKVLNIDYDTEIKKLLD